MPRNGDNGDRLIGHQLHAFTLVDTCWFLRSYIVSSYINIVIYCVYIVICNIYVYVWKKLTSRFQPIGFAAFKEEPAPEFGPFSVQIPMKGFSSLGLLLDFTSDFGLLSG